MLEGRGHTFYTNYRHRSHRPPVRGARRRLRPRTERGVRLRALGPPPPPAAAGARPRPASCRCTTRGRGRACCSRRRSRHCSPAAGRAGSPRSERPRPDLHVLVAARAANHVQRRRPGLPGRNGRPARRAARPDAPYWRWEFPTDGCAPYGTASRARGGTARTAHGCDAHSPAGRRAGGCVPVAAAWTLHRWSRWSGHRARPAAHVLDRVRRRGPRRDRVPAADGSGTCEPRNERIQCSLADIAASFPDTIRHAERPVLRTAPTPMRLLSGLVRRSGVKVVLTGEGADEVLGGYDIFKEAKVRRFWARNPASAWRPALLKRLYPYLDLTSAQSAAYLREFFGVGLDRPTDPFFSHLPRWRPRRSASCSCPRTCASLVEGSAVERFRADCRPGSGAGTRFDQAEYLEARTLLPSYLLSSQGDRMLMAHSVEGRFPFLDHRLIEFAMRYAARSAGCSCWSGRNRTATGSRRRCAATAGASCSPVATSRRTAGSTARRRPTWRRRCPASSPPATSGAGR